MMKSDKGKTLIPCYKDLDAYDMPKEFKNLQGQDMGKLGWLQDLIRGVQKLLHPENASVLQRTDDVSGAPKRSALLERASLALEESEWEKAAGYLDQVLNSDAQSVPAYQGLALVDNRCNKWEDLKRRFEQCEEMNLSHFQ